MPAGYYHAEMEYIASAKTWVTRMSRFKWRSRFPAQWIPKTITPEFVRDEVARGRAIIPANVNHPELEPMIIGRISWLRSMLTSELGVRRALKRSREDALGDKWGADHRDGLSTGKNIHATREWIIRNSPVRSHVPIYQALEKVGGRAKS